MRGKKDASCPNIEKERELPVKKIFCKKILPTLSTFTVGSRKQCFFKISGLIDILNTLLTDYIIIYHMTLHLSVIVHNRHILDIMYALAVAEMRFDKIVMLFYIHKFP